MKSSQRIPSILFTALMLSASRLPAAVPNGFLGNIRHHITLTSTVADNGDQNPYAIIVAPVSAGKIQQGDVLVDNFNKVSNLQGTGSTIMDYNPTTKNITQIADVSSVASQCPGGIGLGTAMIMLKSGWIIVGSTPSRDGTTRTKGDGGLIVLDANGHVATVWANTNINGPWGNIAAIDNGTNAQLFISMAGFDVPPPGVRDAEGFPVTVRKATVLRLDLSITDGQPPVITGQTVVASGFGQRADRGAFLIGPTGLALGPNDTLYISDALGNQIVSIPNASTRTTSAGTGQTVCKDGLLHRPLALTMTPQGHLLAINASKGQVVEVDPATGKQLYAQWIDADQAQSPPGNGDLFGLAMTPDGQGFYYVEDDMNTIVEATR